ncbi:MAG: energy transducer TonB [Chitinophagales bacterium]
MFAILFPSAFGQVITTTTGSNNVAADTANHIYEYTDVMPEFPGGSPALYYYLSSHLKYPKKAMEDSVQGTVYIKFIVDHNGKVVEPKVLRGVSAEIDAEALRVIQELPDWNPGRMNGKPVDVYYTIPLKFTLME